MWLDADLHGLSVLLTVTPASFSEMRNDTQVLTDVGISSKAQGLSSQETPGVLAKALAWVADGFGFGSCLHGHVALAGYLPSSE